MSSNAWQPRTVAGQAEPTGHRVARIVAPEGESAAKPIEWREVGAAPGRAGGKSDARLARYGGANGATAATVRAARA